MSPPTLTGVILAGGQASRMNGEDKGLIPLAGRPMIEHVIQALRPQVGELLINANRNLDRYRRYRYPVISDTEPGFAGPLAGIAAALERSSNDLVLSVPCDGPRLPPDLGSRLWHAMRTGGSPICVVHDGTRLQPVFALVHRRMLPSIRDYLAAGDRKLKLWLNRQHPSVVDFSDFPEAFSNVNTPEEQARMEQNMSPPDVD